MPPASNLDWLYHSLGLLIAAAGLFLLLWALFWDRSRGRWRCPKCWYDMGGVPTPRCPECGKELTNERHMLRTRRHKWWAALALLIIVLGYPAFWARRIAAQGWIGAAPTSPLLWWVIHREPPETYRNNALSKPTRYAAELARRAGEHELTNWQFRWMLEGVGAVRARPVWPARLPYSISTGIPHWLQPQLRTFDVVSPLSDAERPMHNHNYPWSVGRIPDSAPGITLKVTTWNWSGDWHLPVKQVAKPEEAITPLTSPDLDAAVRAAMDLGIRKDVNAATKTNWILGVRVHRDRGPIPSDLAIALRIDLLFEDQPRAGWPLRPYDSMYGDPADWTRINLPEQALSGSPGWTIRVRGDAAAALLDVTRPKCWTGEFTVPVSEFIKE